MVLCGRNAKKRTNFEGWGIEFFFLHPQYLENGWGIFAKCSWIAVLPGSNLRFEPEVSGSENFEGSGGQSGQMAFLFAGGSL